MDEIMHNSKKIIIRINLGHKNGTRMVKVDKDNIRLGLPTFFILILNMTPLSQHYWLRTNTVVK